MRALLSFAIGAILASLFWIWFYGSVGTRPDKRISTAGDKVVVNPPGGPPVAIADSVEVGPAGLAIPVSGVKASQLTDTFTQARAGGARSHDAIDIMADEGTPVIAAADGTIEKLFNSARGGITAYERSIDGRWIYYYAHLSAYAPGLAEGQKVQRGQLIGKVGHTGDASASGPHLHFAINRMGPGEKWWNGTPINPYPLLAGKPVSG
jgi:murein DD-endopeptidase MepM/ murein hydrolase activator NlpD